MKRWSIFLLMLAIMLINTGCNTETPEQYTRMHHINADYDDGVPEDWESQFIEVYNIIAGLANRGGFDDLDSYNSQTEDMDIDELTDQIDNFPPPGGFSENEILFQVYLASLNVSLKEIEIAKSFGDEKAFTENAEKIKGTISDLSEKLE